MSESAKLFLASITTVSDEEDSWGRCHTVKRQRFIVENSREALLAKLACLRIAELDHIETVEGSEAWMPSYTLRIGPIHELTVDKTYPCTDDVLSQTPEWQTFISRKAAVAEAERLEAETAAQERLAHERRDEDERRATFLRLKAIYEPG